MKTHCNSGHEFTPENTKYAAQPNGRVYRVCRQCARERSETYYKYKTLPKRQEERAKRHAEA